MPDFVNPRPFFSNTRNPDADKPESSKNASARYHASQCLSLGNYNRQLPTSEAVDEGSSADELSRLPFFTHTKKLDAERPESPKGAAARCHALRCPPLGHYDRQFTGSETLDQDSPVDELSNGGSSSFSLVSGYERRGWGFSGLDPMLISSAKLRCCDVYIGLHGRKSSLLRFVKWLRAELELHGVSCLVADRSRCNDAEQQRVVEKAMTAATLGVVIVTKRSFSNPFSIKELRFFLSKKNLVPIFFGLSSVDCLSRDVIEKQGELWEKYGGDLWLSYGGSEKEWKEAVDGLSRVGGELKLEAHAGNWRDCISQALILLGMRLGRKYMMERLKSWKERVKKEEFPFPRNSKFVGRKKELLDLELILFGDIEGDGENECFELKTSHKKLYLRTGRGTENKGAEVESIDKADKQHDDDKGKGFEPMLWKESEDEIEIEGLNSLPMHYLLPWGKNGSKNVKKGKTSANVIYGKGIACVSGNSGIGKTELLLEFAYRFSQRYRMVLWIGGEARYICQNYMNLLSLLGVDLSDENGLCPDGDGPRSLRELEEEAIRRVRKELMRDIPFLVVIDNLEDDKDWWSRKDIMDLLPRFGGETHVIISTRLPQILNLEPLRLSYLSGAEALSLMKGTLKDLPVAEMDALRIIEEKLGRITLGLTLVGAIFSELSISPGRLLETINAMPLRNLKWSGREDPVLRHNRFLVQLLDVCFLIFDHEEPPRSLATRMVLVSGWFAPSPIPVSVLALAAAEIMEDRHGNSLWKKCIHAVCCKCFTSYVEKSEAEASAMLVRFGVARGSTKHGCIQVHDIFKLYARKRGGITVASVMVRAINVYGSLPQDCAHVWAACFLLFRFGTDPVVVELNVTDLLSFTRRLALPLAILTYSTFQYNSAKELLHQCIETLEAAEESLISHVEKGLEKPLCCTSADQWKKQLNPALYQELALLKATLLETNAKLMLKGGDYDSAELLCRSVISIRKVLCGWDHSLTISAREIMDKIVRSQANI